MEIIEQLLYTTLHIECFNDKDIPIWNGTGFLLQRPVDTNIVKIYLVSNKHVLKGAYSIALTFNTIKNGLPNNGNYLRIPIKDIVNGVCTHTNPDVDIAILDCTNLFNIIPNLFVKTVPYEMLADFTEPELTVAQNVFFIGYPDDRYDKSNNLPLIRNGLISSHPKYDFNDAPQFIIDAQVFPGSSGSPVYIDLTYENFKNGQIVLGKRNIKLLGIVSQTMIRNNAIKAIPAASIPAAEEVLGLGIVFKATALKELIDQQPIDN